VADVFAKNLQEMSTHRTVAITKDHILYTFTND